jgi:hypothetical protein
MMSLHWITLLCLFFSALLLLDYLCAARNKIQILLAELKLGPYYDYESDIAQFAAESFGAFQNFSLLLSTDYTVLKHTSFPRYSVCIRETNFCDGRVK